MSSHLFFMYVFPQSAIFVLQFWKKKMNLSVLHRVVCFPRNLWDAIKIHMRVCNKLPEKTRSRPVSSWSQISHLRAFLSMSLFSTWGIYFTFSGSFFSCICLNKNLKCSQFNCPYAQKPAALLMLLMTTLFILGIIEIVLYFKGR